MQKKILIVDDFQNTRYVTRTALEREGYKVLEACDGKDALKHFNGQGIDLVITDLNMPVMDGITLVEEIKKLPLYRYVPILLLTTETSEAKKKRAFEAGITGWIKKPFTFDRFLEMVKKALK